MLLEIFKVIKLIYQIKIGLFDAKIYEKNNYIVKNELRLKTNFDLQRIKTLYSNLSSLNLIELYELRKIIKN